MFDRLGLAYERDRSQSEREMADKFSLMGLGSAPIVVVPGDQWSGFRPDRINALKDQQ